MPGLEVCVKQRVVLVLMGNVMDMVLVSIWNVYVSLVGKDTIAVFQNVLMTVMVS